MRSLVTTLLCVASSVAFVLPARAEEVVLVTGEKLEARVVERSAAGVWLHHPVLGKLWVRADQLTSVGGRPLIDSAPPAFDTSDLPGATPTAPAAAENPWKWTLEVGASGKSGNSDTTDLHAAITATQEDDEGRWKGAAVYDYAEASKAKTKDQSSLGLTRDFKLPDSPWFVFVTGRVEWDDFQAWDNRLTLGAGTGRTLLKESDYEVRMRLGLQGVKEHGSTDESWRAEGVIGIEGHWQINTEQRLEGSTTYFPDLEESGERRIESALSWSIKLDAGDNLRLKLGIKNEYDSHRVDPFETNDFQYFAALLYEF